MVRIDPVDTYDRRRGDRNLERAAGLIEEPMAKLENSGEAVIEDRSLVIRVSLEALPMVLEGAWAMGKFDTRYKITDASEFAKELMYALNREDEQGTTPIHKLFDQAILDCLESGAFGIDEHEDQTV